MTIVDFCKWLLDLELYMWKQALKNTGITLVGVVASRFFIFLYNMLVVRELSVRDYATFSYLNAIQIWILVFSHLDLYSGLSKYVSESHAKGKDSEAWSYYTNAAIMTLLLSLVGTILGTLFSFRQDVYLFVTISFMGSLIFMSIMTTNDGFIKGFEQFEFSAVINVSMGIGRFLLLYLALIFLKRLNLNVILILFTLAALIPLIVSFYFIQRLEIKQDMLQKNMDRKKIKELFDYSKWVCLTDLLTSGVFLTGNIILSLYSYEDLARFNVIILMYSIFQMGLGAISTVLIPQVARKAAKKEQIAVLGQSEFRYLAILTLIIITSILILPYKEQLLIFLFKKTDYSRLLIYVAILLLSFPFRIITMTNKGVLQGLNYPKSVTLASLGTFCANGLLFLFLYKEFGLLGAIISLDIAFFVEYILTKLATRNVLQGKHLYFECP